MGVSCVYGLPGKNKSHFATFYAIYLANKYEKPLVTNYILNPTKLAAYCKFMNYRWLFDNLNNGKTIYYVSLDKDLSLLLSVPNAVVVCDEAAIYFPARGSTHNTPKKVLADLVQVRHKSQYLILIAQAELQIDSAIRALCEEIFWCNGVSIWSQKLKNQQLIYKVVRRFMPESFQQFMSDPKLRKNPLKVKLLSSKSWTGFPTCADSFLFSVYNSFNTIQSEDVKTVSRSLLHYSLPKPKIVFPIPKNSEPLPPPSVVGFNPYSFHRYSKITSILFKKIPPQAFKSLLKLDNALSFIANLNFTNYEILAIRFISGFALLFIISAFV